MKLKNCAFVLFVKDAKIARDFYEGLLGLKVKADFGGLNIIFREGFALWQIMEDNIILQKLGKENIFDNKLTSRTELSIETEDIEDVYLKMKNNGVKFLHEMNMEIWGQRNIRFYDPDGHLVEIGESEEVFVRRIYEEENRDMERTSKRTFISEKIINRILKIKK